MQISTHLTKTFKFKYILTSITSLRYYLKNKMCVNIASSPNLKFTLNFHHNVKFQLQTLFTFMYSYISREVKDCVQVKIYNFIT